MTQLSKIGFIAALVFLCAYPALAKDTYPPALVAVANKDDDKDLSSPYAAIPKYFLQKIRTDLTLEDFIARSLQPIRQYSVDHQSLSKNDVVKIRANRQSDIRASQVREILSADTDNDGKVTTAEATEYVLRRNPSAQDEALKEAVKHFMRLDADNNGVVDFDEMRKPDESRADREDELTQIEDLITAIGQDGKITVTNLEATTRKTFAIFDTNKDGILSSEETEGLQKWQRGQYSKEVPSTANCKMPSPAQSDQVVLLGAHEGYAYSSVTMLGQDQETSAANLTIEKGDKPIYLILSSFEPIVWQIDGARERIARVVVLGTRLTDKKLSGGGVTGIAKDKVSFAAAKDCGKYFYKTDSIEAAQAKGAIKQALHREVDSVIGDYKATRISVPSGKEIVSDDDVKKARDIPEGFEKFSWREALHYRPGGIATIKVEDVVAEAPPETYEVLPQDAGISQLMGRGILERLSSRDYKIVKALSRFPAGLTGGHSLRFLLAKGVPEPKGDSGHSCVISEETGSPIGQDYLCQ